LRAAIPHRFGRCPGAAPHHCAPPALRFAGRWAIITDDGSTASTGSGGSYAPAPAPILTPSEHLPTRRLNFAWRLISQRLAATKHFEPWPAAASTGPFGCGGWTSIKRFSGSAPPPGTPSPPRSGSSTFRKTYPTAHPARDVPRSDSTARTHPATSGVPPRGISVRCRWGEGSDG